MFTRNIQSPLYWCELHKAGPLKLLLSRFHSVTKHLENHYTNGPHVIVLASIFVMGGPHDDMLASLFVFPDTVIGDPLFTVPIPDSQHLCYEIRGTADRYFNFISDSCVSVNAHYVEHSVAGDRRPLHVVDQIGIRAVDNASSCVNILVDRNGCTTSVNSSPRLSYSRNGITVVATSAGAVVNVPNCNDVDLEMEIICENMIGVDMLRFEVTRGTNLREVSHGLLGNNMYISSCSWSLNLC